VALDVRCAQRHVDDPILGEEVAEAAVGDLAGTAGERLEDQDAEDQQARIDRDNEPAWA
jgi:hypothetical protein